MKPFGEWGVMESAYVRCQAILKNGRECKREGQPTLNGVDGGYVYYCLAHRRLLKERGMLPPPSQYVLLQVMR